MMNTDITITTINDEPRVLDTDLAEALGMTRPRDIRAKIIIPNRDELDSFGPLRSESAMVTIGSNARREVTQYYLNEEQALLVCMLSRTERAKQVRAEIIRVFTAWRRGELQPVNSEPQLPDFTNPAEAARAWAEQFEAREALQIENDEMHEELNVLTVDEFRSLNHRYLTHGQKVKLGQEAGRVRLMWGRPKHPKQARELVDGCGDRRTVFLNVYDRDVLAKASEVLGYDMT